MIRRALASDLVLHGAIVFIGLIVANVLNYLYYVVSGRILGVEGYGELTSLTSAVLTLAAPANVAQIVVARFIAGFAAAGDLHAKERLTRSVVRASLMLALLVAIVGTILSKPIAGFFHVASFWPIVVSAASLGMYAVITVQRGVLQGASRFGELSTSYCVESVLRLVVGAMLAVWYGPLGALLGLLVGVIGCFYYDEWALRAHHEGATERAAAGRERTGSIAWRIGVAQLMLTVLSFYDVVLVRHLFGARDAGLYAAAALVGRVMLGLLAFVPMLVMPKTTARASVGASGIPLFVGAMAIAAAIAAVGSLAALAAPRMVVELFAGRAFGDAAPVVPLYVMASAALGLANVAAAYQFGLHRYAFVLPVTVVACAEVFVIAFWHPSIATVVATLLAGHLAFFFATLIGLGGTQHSWASATD